MFIKKTVVLLAAVSVLSACTESATEHGKSSSGTRIGVLPSNGAGPVYRENMRSLDGPQSVALVVGNTVIGRYTDTAGIFVDYYDPDGRFVSREPNGEVHRGKWKARYTEFCIEYDNHPQLAHQRCFSFFESGGRYASFRPGGVGFYDIDSITPGNVENLPLE